MKTKPAISVFLLGCLVFLAGTQPVAADAEDEETVYTVQIENQPLLDVPYVPTPPEVVQEMLSIAAVSPRDTLYDLGCGDGRIVVAAAKERNVRLAVGIDIDPRRIAESNENARKAGVSERAIFREKNLFDMDFNEASVVTMYLLPSVNLKLRPKLLSDLAPGSRIVSHDFDMGDWLPDREVKVNGHTIYYWVVPGNVSGIWEWSLTEGGRTRHYVLHLGQRFQNIDHAELSIDGSSRKISEIRLNGAKIDFIAEELIGGQLQKVRFTGMLDGNTLRGDAGPLSGAGGRKTWAAERTPASAMPIDFPDAPRIHSQVFSEPGTAS